VKALQDQIAQMPATQTLERRRIDGQLQPVFLHAAN
jgi:hypothetical protein